MSVVTSAEFMSIRGYIDTLCDMFQVSPDSISASLTGTKFLQDNPKDVSVNTTKNLGLVMSLMYLAVHENGHPHGCHLPRDQVCSPTQSDYNKAKKILGYVLGTKNRTLLFKVKSHIP
jgi:hypothetical protein